MKLQGQQSQQLGTQLPTAVMCHFTDFAHVASSSWDSLSVACCSHASGPQDSQGCLFLRPGVCVCGGDRPSAHWPGPPTSNPRFITLAQATSTLDTSPPLLLLCSCSTPMYPQTVTSTLLSMVSDGNSLRMRDICHPTCPSPASSEQRV